MAVYKPKYRDAKTGKLVSGSIWWYEFNFAGSRVRESSKSTRKTIAILAEENRRKELQRAYAGQRVLGKLQHSASTRLRMR